MVVEASCPELLGKLQLPVRATLHAALAIPNVAMIEAPWVNGELRSMIDDTLDPPFESTQQETRT